MLRKLVLFPLFKNCDPLPFVSWRRPEASTGWQNPCPCRTFHPLLSLGRKILLVFSFLVFRTRSYRISIINALWIDLPLVIIGTGDRHPFAQPILLDNFRRSSPPPPPHLTSLPDCQRLLLEDRGRRAQHHPALLRTLPRPPRRARKAGLLALRPHPTPLQLTPTHPWMPAPGACSHAAGG